MYLLSRQCRFSKTFQDNSGPDGNTAPIHLHILNPKFVIAAFSVAVCGEFWHASTILQIFNNILLMLVDSSCQNQEKYLPGLQNGFHANSGYIFGENDSLR
jgi:hypothetical protein